MLSKQREPSASAPTRTMDRRRFLVTASAVTIGAASAGMLLSPQSAIAASSSYRLREGQQLTVGESIRSQNGQAKLLLQSDGNLVIYSLGVPLWNTKTVGSGAKRLVLQGDGNLVLYASGGRPVWHTRTGGTDASEFRIEDYGLIKLVNPGGKVRWHNNTRSRALYRGKELRVGQILVANDLGYRLVLQGDGNLVLYRKGGSAKWSSRTNTGDAAERPTRLVHQNDGNLVLYTADGRWKWQSATASTSSHRLLLQKDGNLVLYTKSREPLWHRHDDTSRRPGDRTSTPKGSKNGAEILAAAKTYPSGEWAGQCKAFVGNRVRDVMGFYPTGYQEGFARAGATSVSAADAAPGDIIQVTPAGSTDATAERDYFAGRGKLHTAIIERNRGSGVYAVIDSNWGGDERIRHHDIDPSRWAPGDIVKYWRF